MNGYVNTTYISSITGPVRTDLSGGQLGQVGIQYDLSGSRLNTNTRITENILHVEPSNAFSEVESLASVAWEGGQNLSEEDILANTNLQTASLFKRFKGQLNDCNKFLKLYTEQLKEFQDSIVKVSLGMQTVKKICGIFNEAGLGKIQEKHTNLEKEINDAKSIVVSEIKKRIYEKNEEFDKISLKFNCLRKIILAGIDEIVKPDDMQKKMCPICFENEVNIAFVPCGHTYCKPCADIDHGRYTNYAKCPQCRTQINAHVKLYFTV